MALSAQTSKLNEVAELRGDGAIELIQVKIPERTERRMRTPSKSEENIREDGELWS